MAAIDGRDPPPEHRTFVMAAGACAAAALVFLAWTSFGFGGRATTVAVGDIGAAGAALFAALSCAYAAGRSSGRMRSAWRLLALSALSWGLGEIVWSVYQVGLGVAVPFPSAADLGQLAAVPLAVAGILRFPSAPSKPGNRLRLVLDGAIVAAAVVYVAWGLGLGDAYHQGVGGRARLVGVTYPATDIVILAILALLVRKATGSLRAVTLLLVAAFVANLVADASFGYTVLRGSPGAFGPLLNAGWVFGYLTIALAARWPAHGVQVAVEKGLVERWQLAMPWAAVFALALTTSWLFVATGDHPGPTLTGVGVVMGVLFLASQALLLKDSLGLLARSRRAESQLRERTALLDEIINRAPLGIARVGVDLRVIDANPRLCALLRAPRQIMLGSSVVRYLAPEDMQRVMEKFAPLWHGEVDVIEAESPTRRADGSSVWLHWSATTVRNTNGKVDYFLALFEDISAKHESEQSALANLAELERISRLKSEFMSMVSHEFRTALTGIQGYSELMSSEDVTPHEVKEFSSDINSDALRLNRMITEMLDLDRIESGRITLHVAPLDLNQILRDGIERAQLTTAKHGLKADLDPASFVVEGDSDRLIQVVANLLSNAVKYSPGGGEVLVTSRLQDGTVQVSVKDHGQGIPPEFKSRIFGRYERYEGDGKSQVVGTGLGLAIAQQIIQLHQGRIWVDSTLGEGSEFHFTVPARLPVGAVRPYRLAADKPASAA